MKFTRDWKEDWIDRMGLIVALSSEERFRQLCAFKTDMIVRLSPSQRSELRFCIKQRFTPTNGQDGCESAMDAVKEAAE